ncbi:FMN phosphatase YigB (HAD superfamily) [Homoserinimonas aerilata]|uniref:FMN phosphatase YigB (HAD superfamily) n=1 Tax=Homoserinimonas aerilata TaxID=1162970 RepID=A0A542YJE9_9MICO|nr:HAD family hydrolase [Homoserinimonas aerilata]TQL48226.1 FMN phosphatase YigB (HAD superfamily) [Homoserinimonas aerilata]
MRPTIVFDFDGTIATGSGPVMAYARQAAPAAGDGFLAHVHEALAAFESGEPGYRDGYDIVGSLAAAAGVSPAELSTAYEISRGQLGSEHAPVEAMPELVDFLTGLRRHARLILATNAPASGIEPLLERWGVHELFDELRFTVGKPAGLSAVIRDAIASGPVLAVGDIVENDLAPALALGADTALVGATASHAPDKVTMRAHSLAELRGDIEAWAAAAAAASVASPSAPAPQDAVSSPTAPPNER